jgi:pimeloyl-ACP methyl ester carboxylesterase
MSQTDSQPGMLSERIASYPLFRALLGRRSRRFGQGRSLAGPLAHKSLAPAGHGEIVIHLSGRTVPSGDATHAVTLFVVNDEGGWMLRRPQDYPRGEVPALAAMARFVNALLDRIGVAGPVNLVVHDFGGQYGLSWAVCLPGRVRRIVIMNTVYFADYRWHLWARIWRTPLLGELSLALLNRWTFAFELRRGSRRLSSEHIRRTYAMMGPRQKQRVLCLYRAAHPGAYAPWNERLRVLTRQVPTLVLWADEDPYIAPHYAERFGAAEVHHVPGCGHWLPLEDPATVVAHLECFLA